MNASLPNLTLAERERWAYANGDTETLALLQPALVGEEAIEELLKINAEQEQELLKAYRNAHGF